MICPVCGKEIPDYTIFCAQCGSRVDKPATAPPRVPQPASEPRYVPPVQTRNTEETQAFTPVQNTQQTPVPQYTPPVRQEYTQPAPQREVQREQDYGDNYNAPAKNPLSAEKQSKLFAIGAALLQLVSIILMLVIPAFKETDALWGDVTVGFFDTFVLGMFDDSVMGGCMLGVVGVLLAIVSLIIILIGALGSQGVRSGTAYASAGMSIMFVLCEVIAVFALFGGGTTFTIGGWIAVALSVVAAGLIIFAGIKSKSADAPFIPGSYY